MSDRKAARKRSMWVTVLLGLAAAGLASATLAGRLGGFWWAADLSSHFAVYYALAGAGLCVVTALFRRWAWFGLALLALVVNTAVIHPMFTAVAAPGSVDTVSLKLALVNVWHRNRDSVRVGDFLRSCDADVVVLQEVDPWWDRTLGEIDIPYRIAVSRPGEGSFGMALLVHERLSDSPGISLEGTRVFEFAEGFEGAERPVIEATLLLGGRRVRLLGIHPPPPVSARNTALRDSVLGKARQWADEQTDPHIIIGDLNTTPWSYAFSILTGGETLVSTLDGWGNQGTWPARMPMPLLLPIDHCLVSRDWACTDRRIGTELGSDHLPLVVSLILR